MLLLKQEGFTFDDILLVPQYSDIASRSEVDLSVEIADGLKLKVPIIAANMDTICETEMVKAMQDAGGLGILHRYASYEVQESWFKELESNYLTVPSVGISDKDIEFALSVFPKYGIKHVCLDVAHGFQKRVMEATEILSKSFKVIAGNVATDDAYMALFNRGASVVKVGIGPGAACSTRVVTGHGVPQAYAIYNTVHNGFEDPEKMMVIADGGLRNSGDIAKALALGAKAVMTGSLLSGTDEVPNRGRGFYRGMASEDAQLQARGKVSNGAPEGVSFPVESKGSVKKVVEELAGGIRSACTYSGARNLAEFYQNVVVMKVSANTANENKPHGLK